METLERSRTDEINELENILALPAYREQMEYNREMRAYHDATTWLAETLDGRMLTTFEYGFDGRELYASDGGELGTIFKKSLHDARALAEQNPTLSFELRRRRIELDEYGDMLKMARGELPNTMITVSDFPPELINSSASVGGYNATRKQTMLRIITRTAEGKLRMQSQSLDGSNRQALEAIYASFDQQPEDGELLGQRIFTEQDEVEQEFLVDKLAGLYDRSLEQQYPGKSYRAGRVLPDNPGVETYRFVCSQPDLVDLMTEKMLAGQLDENVMYSVAATMANRYENGANASTYNVAGETIKVAMPLEHEMFIAVSRAIAENRSFSGCGTSVGANGEVGAGDQLAINGFGNKAGEDQYGSLEFDCPHCHKNNTRPYGQLIPNCRHCHKDVSCK